MVQVGVVGLGYVGLPLALLMADSGHEVIGVDVDQQKVDLLRDGESYVNDVKDSEVQRRLRNDAFEPTTNYGELSRAEYISVCVPTPLRKTGQPDVSYVVEAAEELSGVVREGCTVILESTVYPGATEEVVASTLSGNGFRVGEDVYVAFSPERIDPGNEEYSVGEIPKVLGGVTRACGDSAEGFYSSVFEEVVRVDSAVEAELVKLLENTYRSVNIGLINEMATVANELDADIWNVVEAADSKPFGFEAFYPGPGLGGHCIPVDPMYLSWKANQTGLDTRFIDLADQVNREMPEYVVQRLTYLLNQNDVSLSNAEVLVLGVAYKPGVSDTRESPALDVIHLLEQRGASVTYHDPFVPSVEVVDRTYESRELTPETLGDSDCAVVVTDHDEIDMELVVGNSSLVFDTRNATKGHETEHVYKL